MLETWEPLAFSRQLGLLESAMLAAMLDAHADTRATGRRAFAAYGQAWPEQAGALLQALPDSERVLREKLQQALTEQYPGEKCIRSAGACG